MKNICYITLIFYGLLLTSCGSNPYAKTNKIYKQRTELYAKQLKQFPLGNKENDTLLNYGKFWVGTTNFNLRRPNYVIIHHTAQDSLEETLNTFTMPAKEVSSHYVIDDNGEVYQMLNDYYRGWHAGTGKWGHNTDLNSASIGIELDNDGTEPFSEAQISSLTDLLGILKEKYSIPTANFIGHSDIAPTRKVDPSVFFPWERLAEEGFGYWYDDIDVVPGGSNYNLSNVEKVEDSLRTFEVTANEIAEKGNPEDILRLTMNPEIALRLIGYDTSDLDAAIRAFKLHFIQKDISTALTEEDLKILYNLSQKYL